jgi:hypothetical protein
VTFRGQLDAARIRLAELERKLEARQSVLRERDEALAERDRRLAALAPTERHHMRLRQLQAAIEQAKQETEQFRRLAAALSSSGRGGPP